MCIIQPCGTGIDRPLESTQLEHDTLPAPEHCVHSHLYMQMYNLLSTVKSTWLRKDNKLRGRKSSTLTQSIVYEPWTRMSTSKANFKRFELRRSDASEGEGNVCCFIPFPLQLVRESKHISFFCSLCLSGLLLLLLTEGVYAAFHAYASSPYVSFCLCFCVWVWMVEIDMASNEYGMHRGNRSSRSSYTGRKNTLCDWIRHIHIAYPTSTCAPFVYIILYSRILF